MENLPNPAFLSERAGAARSLALRSFEAETGPFGSRPGMMHLGKSGVGRKRVMSRAVFLLAAVPLLAAGYFVRDSDLIARAHLYSEAFLTGSGATDVVRPAPPQDAITRAPLSSAALDLFKAGGKQPRADLLGKLARTQTVRKRPHVMVAAITPFSDTASLPDGPANTARVNRTVKQARLDRQRASQTLLSQTADDPAWPENFADGGNPYLGIQRASAAIFMMAPTASPSYVDSKKANEKDPIAWPGRLHLASLKMDDGESLFGGFTEQEFRARELRCMTAAIYFEARSESRRGQIAVAQVVMNRVRASAYPDTICGVIYQGQSRRNSCQFSFACDGKPERPDNKVIWKNSMKLAQEVMNGKHWLTDLGYATHYHATYVNPRWARHFNKVVRIGRHIFYKAPKIQVRVADTFELD
jgi:hypothetical protein